MAGSPSPPTTGWRWPRACAAGHSRLRAVGERRRRTWRCGCSTALRPIAVLRLSCADAAVSFGRAPATCRRFGWNARRAISSACSRLALPDAAAVARSRPLGRQPSRRQSEAGARNLSVPAGRRRGPAPDPCRAGSCRHHRAGPLPLHRQAARRSCGWRSGWAMCTRASRRLMAGAEVEHAARLVGRISGDSTVAYASPSPAPSRPPLHRRRHRRAPWLRAIMAELERLAHHINDVGAICNDACFAIMHAALRHAARARAARRQRRLRPSPDDRLRRAGRRRGRPRADEGVGAIRSQLIAAIRRACRALSQLYDRTTSLQDRTVATGFLAAELAPPVRRRRLCRPRFRPRLRCTPRARAMRLTTSSTSRCGCTRATSMRA